MGRHHFDLQNYGKALKNFDCALQIYQNTTIDSKKNWILVLTLHDIGRCHIYLQNYDKAKENFNCALQIYQNACFLFTRINKSWFGCKRDFLTQLFFV